MLEEYWNYVLIYYYPTFSGELHDFLRQPHIKIRFIEKSLESRNQKHLIHKNLLSGSELSPRM